MQKLQQFNTLEQKKEQRSNTYSVQDSRNAPEKKFISGPVSACVWQNQGAGKTGVVSYRTISFQRVYKDKNGTWQNTNSLRVNDLPRASLVLQKAYEFVALRDSGHNTDYDAEEIVEEII